MSHPLDPDQLFHLADVAVQLNEVALGASHAVAVMLGCANVWPTSFRTSDGVFRSVSVAPGRGENMPRLTESFVALGAEHRLDGAPNGRLHETWRLSRTAADGACVELLLEQYIDAPNTCRECGQGLVEAGGEQGTGKCWHCARKGL